MKLNNTNCELPESFWFPVQHQFQQSNYTASEQKNIKLHMKKIIHILSINWKNIHVMFNFKRRQFIKYLWGMKVSNTVF
jgi:hypothetical protein